MQNSNYFFLIFVATIITIRVALLPRRGHNPTVLGLRIHHYMYGLVMMGISVLISNLTLFAVGLGFLADELPMVGTPVSFHNWDGYYSRRTILGILVLAVVIYIFRSQIISII